MFSFIENIIIIPPYFIDDIHKKTFSKYKKCDKIIFSNYSLFENYCCIKNDVSSKKYLKFYTDNIKKLESFYYNKYVKTRHYLTENNNEEEKIFYNSNGGKVSVSFMKSRFNKPIDDKFPDEIKILVLGWFFNQSVENLPLTLKEIVFGNQFNKSVDNLPFNLETITFGYSFNKSINNLPNSIKSIKLGQCFNQPIDDLPNTLEKIELGQMFNNPINNLPISLTELTILSNYERYDVYKLPKKLQNITFILIQDDQKFISRYNSDNIKYKFFNNITLY